MKHVGNPNKWLSKSAVMIRLGLAELEIVQLLEEGTLDAPTVLGCHFYWSEGQILAAEFVLRPKSCAPPMKTYV